MGIKTQWLPSYNHLLEHMLIDINIVTQIDVHNAHS